MSKFWSNDLETGYYDKILVNGLKKNRGIQANWHNITFQRIKKYLSKEIEHLDYACGSGSLIGLYSSANSTELIFQVNKLSMQVRNMVIEVNSTNLKNLSLIIRKKNMTSLQ